MNDLVTLIDALSVTCAVKLNEPEAVVVPARLPVAGSSVIPAGKAPELIDHWYGGLPPLATSVARVGDAGRSAGQRGRGDDGQAGRDIHAERLAGSDGSAVGHLGGETEIA